MTFTWLGTLATDLDKVRFHLGDTSSDGYWLPDETITALVASEGSVGGAVIAGLKYILTQLSRPDFRADWLQVSNAEARKGYEMLLSEKRREFGAAAISATVTHVYRADSLATAEPDYSDGAVSVDDE